MKLERRHFERYAEVLKDLRYDQILRLTPDQHRRICEHFATDLARTNGGFNHTRFMHACGIIGEADHA